MAVVIERSELGILAQLRNQLRNGDEYIIERCYPTMVGGQERQEDGVHICFSGRYERGESTEALVFNGGVTRIIVASGDIGKNAWITNKEIFQRAVIGIAGMSYEARKKITTALNAGESLADPVLAAVAHMPCLKDILNRFNGQ
ncbi:hypothetical protein HYU93_01935 [Candidatus Daviesbacteria bacterium]|nr:hypothetical protein [Candidatus Daviesbacteria bacterium]